MQHADRPAQIQALPGPHGEPGPRGDAKTLRLTTRLDHRVRVAGQPRRRRHVRQRAAVRSPELKRSVWPSNNLVSLLVHASVMTTTENHEVGKRGGAALRPVADVMPLADAHAAAGEAAALVPMLERPSQRRRNGPGPG